MINILIADDNESKIKNLRNILDSIPEIEEYDIAIDLVSTKKHLNVSRYDLLILDLNIPNRVGDPPISDNGINFINELNRSSRLIKPAHIVGFSAYEDSIEEFRNKYDNDDIWSLIKYEESSVSWGEKIKIKVEYLIQSKRDLLKSTSASSYQYDLAIVTALRSPELESILNLPANWKAFKVTNDATEYHNGIFQNGDVKVRVVAAATSQMGMVATSILAHKIIVNFKPKHIAMTGIAAGIKGNGNYGDILAADISFDSGSGKIKTDENGNSKFEPDFKSINLQIEIKEALIETKVNRDIFNDIKKDWIGNCPDSELKLHIGPLASGAGVIENNKIVDEIKGHQRKLIGIDMETYGLFFAAQNCSKPRPHSALSFKSITDFADPDKSDDYQKYASYTSARFLYYFSLNKMNF